MEQNDNYWYRRVRASRVSRRTLLGGASAAGLGAAGLALVGCGSSSSNKTPTASGKTPSGSATASASPSGTPVAGGSLTTAFTGPFAGVDPHNSVYGGSGIVPEVYNYLIRDFVAVFPNPPAPAVNGIIQDLAVSQELQSDNVTWVFKLRPNVMIAANSQGVPVRALDSSDVLASWNRIKSPTSGSNGYAFANQWIDKMDAPDPQTFRMIMKEPYAWTLASVGNNLIGAIVPKEWLENANLKKNAVGAGPFTLTELVEGDHATMAKNPTYYRTSHPYLDKNIIRAFADLATERTAFTADQIDVYGPPDQDEAKQLKSNNPQLQYSQFPTVGYLSFWMRVDAPPWNDPRVRNAVNWAINRNQYVQIIGKGQGQPIGPLTYAFGKYALTGSDLEKAQPYSVSDAQKAFQAAGITEFTFAYPTSSNVTDYVNIFVQNMKQAGVDAKGQPQDAATWVANYFLNKLTASLSLNQAYQTPDFALQWYMPGGITGNNHYNTGWTDPAVTTAIHDAATKLDETQRVQAYIQAQKTILSKAPPFINFFGLYGNTLVYPYIKNYPVSLSSLGFAYIQDVWTTKSS